MFQVQTSVLTVIVSVGKLFVQSLSAQCLLVRTANQCLEQLTAAVLQNMNVVSGS